MCVPVPGTKPVVIKPHVVVPNPVQQDPIQDSKSKITPPGFKFDPLEDLLKQVNELMARITQLMNGGNIIGPPTAGNHRLVGTAVGRIVNGDALTLLNVVGVRGDASSSQSDAEKRARDLSTQLGKQLAVVRSESTVMIYPPPAPTFHIVELSQTIRQSDATKVAGFIGGVDHLVSLISGNTVTAIAPNSVNDPFMMRMNL